MKRCNSKTSIHYSLYHDADVCWSQRLLLIWLMVMSLSRKRPFHACQEVMLIILFFNVYITFSRIQRWKMTEFNQDRRVWNKMIKYFFVEKNNKFNYIAFILKQQSEKPLSLYSSYSMQLCSFFTYNMIVYAIFKLIMTLNYYL